MKALAAPKIDDALIARVKERILEAVDAQAIYLFGSAARGEADEGSDLDVLVIMELPEGSSSRQEALALRGLFRGWGLPMDIFVMDPDEFAYRRHQAGHLARVADRQGKRIHG